MNFKKNTVIVRGITKTWFQENFIDMKVHFGGDPRAVPAFDADFIGFYLEEPESAITHIGVVSHIERNNESAVFHLKAIIKLDEKIEVGHAIRKQEYWKLKKLGIDNITLSINSFYKTNTTE